jgi:hypothetical protein
MNDERNNSVRDSIRRLRQVVTLGALGLALTHLLFPKVAPPNQSLERTRWAPAVRLRRFGIVARRSAPDPLGGTA